MLHRERWSLFPLHILIFWRWHPSGTFEKWTPSWACRGCHWVQKALTWLPFLVSLLHDFSNSTASLQISALLDSAPLPSSLQPQSNQAATFLWASHVPQPDIPCKASALLFFSFFKGSLEENTKPQSRVSDVAFLTRLAALSSIMND